MSGPLTEGNLMDESSVHNIPAVVFVVDDDAAVRESLRWLIESTGMKVRTYASAMELLAESDLDRAGCLLLDVRIPGFDGLALQERLRENGTAVPIIIITGHADVPMAIRAMKNGAVDFIEKPFDDEVLLDSIRSAMRQNGKARTRMARRNEVRTRILRLTAREHEVYELVVAGWTNRETASKLGIIEKTVEVHRSNIRRKLQADTLADLVRLAVTADVRNEA